jgi:hypothetical protein
MKTTMRKMIFIAAMLASVSGIAMAEERVVEPTTFESFVARPSVVLEIDETVGSFVSSDAKLEVALLVAADTANPPERQRGLRLRLENNAGQDRLYLDEAQVAAAIEDLAGIESGIAGLKAETGAPWRVEGTGRCWRPAHPMRILCPSYGVGPDGSGLWLSAYGGNGFAFPGHRPSTLALLLKEATAALAAL